MPDQSLNDFLGLPMIKHMHDVTVVEGMGGTGIEKVSPRKVSLIIAQGIHIRLTNKSLACVFHQEKLYSVLLTSNHSAAVMEARPEHFLRIIVSASQPHQIPASQTAPGAVQPHQAQKPSCRLPLN